MVINISKQPTCPNHIHFNTNHNLSGLQPEEGYVYQASRANEPEKGYGYQASIANEPEKGYGYQASRANEPEEGYGYQTSRANEIGFERIYGWVI